MSSISDFVRRHRGKIITGAVIAGGAYLAQRFIRQYYEERERLNADRNLARAATAAFGMDPRRMMVENRRFYIFDSNQRTCDNSILQLIPSIKTKLQKRFDVESSADSLKRQTATNADVSSEIDHSGNGMNKLEIWNSMKIDAIARLLSASISYTILVLSLKTQISILAALIYENSKESTPNKFESWYSRMWYNLGGQVADVKPRTGEAKKKFDVSAFKTASGVQQLFLQALQFFTNKGIDSLSDFIRSAVTEEMANLSLKELITLDHLKKILANIRKKVIGTNSSNHHFSFYVVPLFQTGMMPDEPLLEELLIILKTVLESPDAQDLFDYGLDNFIDGAIDFISKAVPEFSADDQATSRDKTSSSNATAVPLARLIPALTDAFHDISTVNFDSILSNFIISQQIHDYCVKVFEKDQSIW